MTVLIVHPNGYSFTVKDHRIVGGPFNGMNCRAVGCDCMTKAPVQCEACGRAHAPEPLPCWQQAKYATDLEWFRRGYASSSRRLPDGSWRREWIKGDEICQAQ